MSIYQRLRDTQPELIMLKVLLLYGLPTLPLNTGDEVNTLTLTDRSVNN